MLRSETILIIGMAKLQKQIDVYHLKPIQHIANF